MLRFEYDFVIGSETSPHAMLFNICRPLIEFLFVGQSSNVLFCGGNSLESLEDNLILLKDGAGSVYWPIIGVNALDGGSGMMNPGFGYAVKIYNDATFSYPDIVGGRFAYSPTPIYPLTKYSESTNTGSNMTIGIPVDSWENMPQEGDEIAAYSENGMLVGSVTYTGAATALTVWGDDATTEEVEGLLDGEEVTFELWRKFEDKIEVLEVKSWVEGSNIYSENGIFHFQFTIFNHYF